MKTSSRPISRCRCALSALAAAVVALGSYPALGEDSIEQQGQKRYQENCAVCHGQDARGGGPFANLLTKQPTNLRALSKNSGGNFPFGKVYDTIDGRDMLSAHGTREMPIWGGQWKREGAIGAETTLRGRILEMIVYLRSVQE